ncbi:M56 family metallopeptidase [Streptomyces sp. NRRL WC-3742]|uniref:M56 family metallopeptidase n=1 Tax=Streptomyces sp. NRRL WC-3742 TaxID=1463934 RepID=UPI0004CA515E|nr:M56 family metallopeptidase [Streptomyces sp. NRRL WC-3742]
MTLALLGLYLAATGALLPRRLAGSARLQAHPVLGAALWLALMASFTVALVLTVHHAVEPFAHEPAGLAGLLPHLEPVGPVLPHTHDWWQPAAVLTLLAAAVATVGARAGRVRRRHRALLDAVAVRDRRWGALVLEHAHPTVYCLPGRRSRIVLSRGALRLLDDREVAAALAHEHGHLRGRHHLLRLPADTFALLLGPLPLARRGREEVALLLEMAADDAALERVSRGELASALCALATGSTPPDGSLGAAATGVLARIRRLARPGGGRRRQLAAWPVVFALPVLPYLLACAPHP